MFKAELEEKLKKMAPKDTSFAVSFPPPEFGDYSTNLALVLAKREGKPPMETAEEIMAVLKKDKSFPNFFRKLKRLLPVL